MFGHAGVVVDLQVVVNSAFLIWAGVRFGFSWNNKAIEPETTGVAIEVPLQLAYVLPGNEL